MKKFCFFFMFILLAIIVCGCNASNSANANSICKNCGEEFLTTSNYCPNCGQALTNSINDISEKNDNTNTEALRKEWTQTEVQSIIKVFEINASDPDSVGGVDLHLSWENSSQKEIKYVYFTIEAYNAVNDIVRCDMRGYSSFTVDLTGPFEPGYSNSGYWGGYSDKYYAPTICENCYYNEDVRRFELTKIRIIYMDNSEIIIDDTINYVFSEYPQGLVYTWNEEYNGYEVEYRIKSLCTETQLVIPETYNDKNVVSIANSAFAWMDGIKTVQLPNTIKNIGRNAFEGCSKMEKINIPAGGLYIGENAFMSCVSLSDIIIPNTVTSIGSYAFSECKKLKSVIIPNSVIIMGSSVFHGLKDLNVYCEAISKPAEWETYWDMSLKNITWGYKK